MKLLHVVKGKVTEVCGEVFGKTDGEDAVTFIMSTGISVKYYLENINSVKEVEDGFMVDSKR